MIDFFIIFSKTGLVLFTYSITGALKGNPITNFIKNVLLEGRSGENSFSYNEYGIKWHLANEAGLIFAAVFHKLIVPVYLDELLSAVNDSFLSEFQSQLNSAT